MDNKYLKLREFLKSTEWVNKDQLETPKKKGEDRPLAVKSYEKQAKIIELPSPKDINLEKNTIKKIFSERKSRRSYNKEELSIKELSYLLWATQGLRKDNIRLRTVPSGGAVHPFETYLSINRVKNIKKGIYRYLPDKHSLLFVKEVDNIQKEITKAANGQKFVGTAAVVFLWTVIPERGEWKYDILAHKLAALDAGHVGQNLYLSVESIGAGTCAVDAYNQKAADELLEVNGEDEFVIYMAPVGKIKD
ncbi:MAG: SagB/ThcOx family dehydrogenase [Halanaerobiales bacterium]|nr:SagB/ThcOx family dehydrogenase [Halanaerobiales bacterium]